MNYNEYRKIEALNNTGMGYLQRSPRHYIAWRNGEIEDTDSEARRLGLAVHCILLEPFQFAHRYDVKGDGRTKAGKAQKAEIEADGKIALSAKDYETATRIFNAVMHNKTAAALIRSTQHEIARTWTDPESGAKCKGLADGWNAEGRVLLEVKTCQNASPDAFKADIAHWQYHRQAAFYADGFGAKRVIMLAIEKTPPYEVGIYELPPLVLAAGREIYKPLARLYANCGKQNRWPGYTEEPQKLFLPAWAIPDQLAA